MNLRLQVFGLGLGPLLEALGIDLEEVLHLGGEL
jgi:hypothetical protein